MTEQANQLTREQWLNAVITLLKLNVFDDYHNWPQIRATISATRGGRMIARSIHPDDSKDNTHEILVSIHTNDSNQIMIELVCQLIHALTGDVKKVSGAFHSLARHKGIIGKMSVYTHRVDNSLQAILSDITSAIGDIPHAAVEFKPASKGRNNNTMTCPCGFKSNLSRVHADNVQSNIINHGGVICPSCNAPSITINFK
jgi:hypothetical protein